MDKPLPGQIQKVDISYDKKSIFGLTHGQIVSKLRELSHLKVVQTFLDDEAENFINDFIGKFQKPTFSYADLWELKEAYLEKLYKTAIAKKHLEADVKYGFYDRGQFFELIFDGAKPITIKNRLGIKYLHYLVVHKDKKVELVEIDRIAGVHPDSIGKYRDDGEMPDESDENAQAKGGKLVGAKETLMTFNNK